MRVGIDYRPVTAAPYSGIARQVLAIEQALLANNIEVIRFTAAPLNHEHRSIAICPPWHSSPHGLHRPHERFKFEAFFLPTAVRNLKPDLYIATANMGLPIWNTPKGTHYALLLHDVFQLTLENYHKSQLRAKLYRWLDYFSISQSIRVADAIWMPSDYTRRETSRLFPAALIKMNVLPNAVHYPIEEINARLPEQLPKRFWLIVGTREPRKNINWFIAQWYKSRQTQLALPDLVLVGNSQDVDSQFRSINGLIWLNDLSDAQLALLYCSAEYLWQPSYAEGFGLPVIEALSQGTSVAVATGSALDEIAPPESIRFDPRNGDALNALMLQLASSPLLLDPKICKAWAASYYPDAYEGRLLKLVTAAIGKQSSYK